jgi:hypothetical protein
MARQLWGELGGPVGGSPQSRKGTRRSQSSRGRRRAAPPEAARHRPPGTEHGPRQDWTHRRGRVGIRSRPSLRFRDRHAIPRGLSCRE